MMSGLFAIFTLVTAAIIFNQRKAAIAILLFGIFLSFWMFCYHATDILKINW